METVYNFIGVFIFGSFFGVILRSWILRKPEKKQNDITIKYFDCLKAQIDKLLTVNEKLSNKVAAKDIAAYASLMEMDKHPSPLPENFSRSDDIEAQIERMRLGQ